MKKGKLAVIVAAASALSCVAFAACSDGEEPAPEHTHVYGSWAITTAPTATTGGKITGTCADDNTKTVLDIPSLSDTSFWSKAENAAATGTDANTTYTNDAYGIQYVVYTHSYGAWQVQTGSAPTADDTGIAMRVCANHSDVTETMALPKLTDEFWTVKSTVPAGCTTAASTTYGNDTYNLTVTVTTGTPAGHTWGEWQIKTGSEPTADKAGTAIRYCTKDDGGSDTKTLPKLTDTTYWTATVKTEATCVDDEMTTYSNATDKLSLDVKTADKTGHDWSAWSWKDDVKPDHTKGGTLVRTCETDETHKDELEVAKLPAAGQSDANWDCTNVPADLNTAEYNVYASKQVSGLVIRKYEGAQKTAAKYDGKTYHSLSFQIQEGDLRVVDSWSAASLTVTGGNMSVGTGEAYPYRGKFEFELVDCDTDKGELKLTKYDIKSSSSSSGGSFGWGDDDEYWELDPDADYDELSLYSVARAGTEYETTPSAVITAWIDWASGIIVTPGNSWSDINVLVPSDTALNKASFKASTVNGVMFISYTDAESHVHNIFIANNRAYLGGSFKDIEDTPVAADQCATSDWIYAYDKGGVKIKGYAKDHNNEMKETDGYEGAYTYGGTGDDLGDVMINGVGGIKIGSDSGLYTKVSDNVVSAVVEGIRYTITLTPSATPFSGSYDYATPEVTITYNLKGVTAVEAVTSPVTVSKDVAMDLPVLTNAGKVFRGWYTDENCSVAVVLDGDGKYVPTATLTLYAKWATNVSLTLNGVKAGDETALVIGEGDVYGDYLPYEVYEVDETTDKYFAGWYTDAGFNNAVTLTATAAAADNGSTLYAKWVETPVYYGTYTGSAVTGSGLYTYGKSGLTMTIAIDGSITGTATWNNTVKSLAGTVVSYDADTQCLTWQPDGKSQVAYMVLYRDATTKQRVVVFDDSVYDKEWPWAEAFAGFTGTANSLTTSCYTVNASGTYVRDARVIMYNNGTSDVTMFEYNNKLYNGVTFEDAAGTALTTVSAIHSSKTLIVKQGGNKIFAIGTAKASLSSGSIVPLDNVYGSYTDAASKSLVLDGVGAGTYDGDAIQYTVDNGTVSFYTMSDTDKTGYYEATLSGATAAVTKPMVTITFDLGSETVATPPTTSYNKNIPFTLPDLTSTSGKVVLGWYTDDVKTTAVTLNSAYKYDPTEDTTIYVDWVMPEVFGGKTYKVPYVYGSGVNVTYENCTFKTNGVGATGDEGKYNTTSTSAPFYKNARITITWAGDEDSSAAFRRVVIKEEYGSTTRYYSGFCEVATGIIFRTYSARTGATAETTAKGDQLNGSSQYVLLPTDVTLTTSNFYGCKVSDSDTTYWVITVPLTSETSKSYLITATSESTTIIVLNSVKDLAGNVITGTYHNAHTLIAYDSSDNPVLKVGYKSSLQIMDGSEGAYTCGADTYVFNGAEKLKKNSESAVNYTTIDTNKYGATIGGVYCEITVDTAAGTCTVVEPKADVTYNFAHATIDGVTSGTAVQKGIKVEFTLPTPVCDLGYQFLGWYTNSDYTGSAVTKVTLSDTTAVTYYAKIETMPTWAAIATASSVTFTDGTANFSGETNAVNQVYYIKFTVSEAGDYVVYVDSVTRVGGTQTGTSYFRAAVLKEDGTKVKDGISKDSATTVTLEAGTYVIAASLGGKAPSYTWTYDCYGTFSGMIVKPVHNTAATAIEYTLGTTVNDILIQLDGKIKTVYKVNLTAGTTYNITASSTAYARFILYSNEGLSTGVKYDGEGSVSSYKPVNTSFSGSFTPTTTGTYYIVIDGNCKELSTFSITAAA